MAERAKLNIFGKDFDVLHCSYSLRRDVDPKGYGWHLPARS